MKRIKLETIYWIVGIAIVMASILFGPETSYEKTLRLCNARGGIVVRSVSTRNLYCIPSDTKTFSY